jgi:hypothetical protein
MKVGNHIFWATAIIAALVLLWVVSDFFYGLSEDFPVFNTAGLMVAASILTLGLVCRHL